jgi:hypothetical protein
MKLPKDTLQESIARQRENLTSMLKEPLRRIATACSGVWGNRQAMDRVLIKELDKLPYGKFLYTLDTNAIQISDNISREGIIEKDFGRDRSQRPYIREVVPSTDFLLSEAYISLRAKRPSLTAIQIVRDKEDNVLGFVGADFDLRDLPLTGEHYEEPKFWRQIKGDPAIRGTVFHQTRVDSQLDLHIDVVLGVMEELFVDHGVFQTVIHFSSSRATIWTMDDPYRYRLLDIEALTDPDVCLAYPRLPYPTDAAIPADQIRPVLETINQLRFMDEMLYLRSCSLNIFNGLVSLTFSCDGSHYIPYDEFLEKDIGFWVGDSFSI